MKFVKLQTLNSGDCVVTYLGLADLQQSQKLSMGRWHLLHNPTEHKSDEFPWKQTTNKFYKQRDFITDHLLCTFAIVLDLNDLAFYYGKRMGQGKKRGH